MNNPLDAVWSTCDSIMKSPKFVWLDHSGINQLVRLIIKSARPTTLWGPPENIKCLDPNASIVDGVFKFDDSKTTLADQLVAYELIASSVNYQYWYGKHDIRINGSGSTKMYELLDTAFKQEPYSTLHSFAMKFIKLLSTERFPVLSQRVAHIHELFDYMRHSHYPAIKDDFHYNVGYLARYGHFPRLGYSAEIPNVIDILNRMIVTFPGFANDILLKRACLFLMQLHRRMGWFKDSIHLVPVPADYQIPKMLRYYGCIHYDRALAQKIDLHELIPQGSQEECEIRAASILACKEIAIKAGCTMCDVDTFLWENRKNSNAPFHLTITTDY